VQKEKYTYNKANNFPINNFKVKEFYSEIKIVESSMVRKIWWLEGWCWGDLSSSKIRVGVCRRGNKNKPKQSK
jgi:hypothetical protein